MSAVDTFYIESKYKVDALMGLQVIYKDVVGTPDGSFNVYETNDLQELYVEIPSTQLPYTIDTANVSIGLPKDGLPFKYIPIIFSKNSMTGGTIKVILNIKQY